MTVDDITTTLLDGAELEDGGGTVVVEGGIEVVMTLEVSDVDTEVKEDEVKESDVVDNDVETPQHAPGIESELCYSKRGHAYL